MDIIIFESYLVIFGQWYSAILRPFAQCIIIHIAALQGLKLSVLGTDVVLSRQVYDLLNHKAQLRVLEDGVGQVQVAGLQEVEVSAPDEVIKIIELGSACRYSSV